MDDGPLYSESNSAPHFNGDKSVKGSYGSASVHYSQDKRAIFADEAKSQTKVSELQNPVTAILISDGYNSNGRPVTIRRGSASAGWLRANDSDDTGYVRHQNRANYAFGDGHVAAYHYLDVKCQAGECWWSAQGDHL